VPILLASADAYSGMIFLSAAADVAPLLLAAAVEQGYLHSITP
jgi:hypothetical protein